MANQTKMCPMGHVIPVEAVFCPFCQSSPTGARDFNQGSAQTRVDFNLEATRLESPPTLFEGVQVKEGKPFIGWLAVIEGNLQGETFHLYEGRNIIGSSSISDIPLSDKGIQGQHSSIRYSSGKYILTDLDSDEGTFLNGKRIHRSELKDGDKIKIGKTVLQVKIL